MRDWLAGCGLLSNVFSALQRLEASGSGNAFQTYLDSLDDGTRSFVTTLGWLWEPLDDTTVYARFQAFWRRVRCRLAVAAPDRAAFELEWRESMISYPVQTTSFLHRLADGINHAEMIAMLDSQCYGEQMRAVVGLGEIGGAEALEALLARRIEPDLRLEIRESIRKIMGSFFFQDPSEAFANCFPALIEFLYEQREQRDCRFIGDVLARMEPRMIFECLQPALAHRQWQIRRTAAEIVGRIENLPASALPVLKSLRKREQKRRVQVTLDAAMAKFRDGNR